MGKKGTKTQIRTAGFTGVAVISDIAVPKHLFRHSAYKFGMLYKA